MTHAEFKAWLEGFAAGIAGAPTPEQWAKVIEKAAQVYEPIPVYPALSPWVLTPSPSIPPPTPYPYFQTICGTMETVGAVQSWN